MTILLSNDYPSTDTRWQFLDVLDMAGMPCVRFVDRTRGLIALRSRELGRWHLSVSQVARIPTWGELGSARDALIPPDVWMMIPHPPRAYWLNKNPNVLHMWEFRDATLIEQFSLEGEHARRIGKSKPDDGGGVPE